MTRKKKVVKKTGYDVRSMGVQLDHIDHNIKLIAEQHGDISTKLDSHDAKFDSINSKLDSHTEMIGALATDMTTVKTNIEIMKSDIEFIKTGLKRKVDVEEFSALEQRVAALERRHS